MEKLFDARIAERHSPARYAQDTPGEKKASYLLRIKSLIGRQVKTGSCSFELIPDDFKDKERQKQRLNRLVEELDLRMN